MQDLTQLRQLLKDTLANDICSFQSLDKPADRRRVLDELMRAIEDTQLVQTRVLIGSIDDFEHNDIY